ncbi:MAG: metallophosphoesterase [Clostridia bacterium]|nr:metallophosphoesterase [Clostridia bacterium]
MLYWFIGAAAVLAALVYYLHFENTSLKTTRYSVSFDSLPQGFDGLTVAQISDYHNTQSAALNRRLREAVRSAKPDVIALTGDLIDRRRTDTDTAIRLARDLCETAPVYYVCGNHDTVSAERDALLVRLTEAGVHVLINEKTALQNGADGICIAGIDDPARAPEWEIGSEVVRRELSQLSLDARQFTILLSHRPEAFAVYAQQGVQLVLAGHAHGGQIRLPFVGGLFAPVQGMFPKFTCGVFRQDRTTMVVSRGVGNSGFPFRVHNRPELVVVTLTLKKS